MSTIDYVFLALCLSILAVMLIGSKAVRAILLETFRHPFRSSHIQIQDGNVTVVAHEPGSRAEEQRRSTAGAT